MAAVLREFGEFDAAWAAALIVDDRLRHGFVENWSVDIDAVLHHFEDLGCLRRHQDEDGPVVWKWVATDD